MPRHTFNTGCWAMYLSLQVSILGGAAHKSFVRSYSSYRLTPCWPSPRSRDSLTCRMTDFTNGLYGPTTSLGLIDQKLRSPTVWRSGANSVSFPIPWTPDPRTSAWLHLCCGNCTASAKYMTIWSTSSGYRLRIKSSQGVASPVVPGVRGGMYVLYSQLVAP